MVQAVQPEPPSWAALLDMFFEPRHLLQQFFNSIGNAVSGPAKLLQLLVALGLLDLLFLARRQAQAQSLLKAKVVFLAIQSAVHQNLVAGQHVFALLLMPEAGGLCLWCLGCLFWCHFCLWCLGCLFWCHFCLWCLAACCGVVFASVGVCCTRSAFTDTLSPKVRATG